MLTVNYEKNAKGLYSAAISGSRGTVWMDDLVWIEDRQDLLEIYYWQAQSVLNGAYHCCLSVPGKVKLL